MRRSALEFKSVYYDAVFAKTRGTLVPALERIINQRIAFTSPDYPVSTESFTQKINDGMQWDYTAQGDGFWRLIYASRSTPNMDKQTVAFRNLLMKNEEFEFVHKDMLDFIDGIASFNDANLGEHEITDRIIAFIKDFFDPSFELSQVIAAGGFALCVHRKESVKALAMALSGLYISHTAADSVLDMHYDLGRIVILFDQWRIHSIKKQLTLKSQSLTMEAETIILTDGSMKGTAVNVNEAVALSSILYAGVDEDSVPYCHISDQVVTLCELSQYASEVVLLEDSVNTLDGYVDISERTVVDYSDFHELPILYHRHEHYGLVRDSNCESRFIHPHSDEVVHCIINSNGDGGWAWRTDAIFCDDNDTYYRNSGVAEEHGVEYSEGRDRYILVGKFRANYAQLRDVDKTSYATKVTFGVEVEKEDQDVMESIDYQSLYNKTGWAKERDGSLDCDTGFEFISPIYDLFDLTKFNEDIANYDVSNHLNADYSDSCGGHFNIAVKGMSSHELLGGLKAFFPLLYGLYPERCDIDYSKARSAYDMILSPTKYSAVFLKSDRIVEFRIFPAVTGVADLKWRIELMQFMIRNYGASEKEVLNMIVRKGSRLNTLLRTYYRRNYMEVKRSILNLSVDYVNHAKRYNAIVVSTELANL
jgi:hypothetical protein